MSDDKDLEAEPTPEPTPEPTAAPQPRRSVLPVVLLMAVILLAAAGGGAGWYFDQQLSMQAAEQQRLATDVQQQLGEAAGRVTVLNQTLESRLEGIARLENRVDDLRDALERQADPEPMPDWQMAEAAWLAQLAIHRVQFKADYDGALEALKAADEGLASLGGAGIDGRAAIAEAVDRLLEADRPDTPLIGQGLTALAQRLDDLPLAQDVASVAAGAEPLADDESLPAGVRERIGRAWTRFVDGLEGLVVVSRDRTVVPLPNPESRFLLQQNLQLKVESARLAALMADPAAFDAALERIDAWVSAYFDTAAPEVVDVRERIEALRGRRVVAEQPDIATPLQRLIDGAGVN